MSILSNYCVTYDYDYKQTTNSPYGHSLFLLDISCLKQFPEASQQVDAWLDVRYHLRAKIDPMTRLTYTLSLSLPVNLYFIRGKFERLSNMRVPVPEPDLEGGNFSQIFYV